MRQEGYYWIKLTEDHRNPEAIICWQIAFYRQDLNAFFICGDNKNVFFKNILEINENIIPFPQIIVNQGT